MMVVVVVFIKVAYLAFVPQSFLKERVCTLYLPGPADMLVQSVQSKLLS